MAPNHEIGASLNAVNHDLKLIAPAFTAHAGAILLHILHREGGIRTRTPCDT